jgi:hypothetical protein
MADFFVFDKNGIKSLSKDTFLIPAFKDLYDKYKKNNEYLNYFSYIYHTCDYSSPYKNYPDSIREEKVKTVFKVNPKCPVLKDAITQYKDFNFSPILSLWESTKAKIFEMTEFLKNTPITEDNFKDIMSIIEKTGKTVESLTKLEEQVKNEKAKQVNVRGGGAINDREL